MSSCRSCEWTILGFCAMAKDTEQLVKFLILHHVLLESWWCSSCGELCRRDLSTFTFRCDRRHVFRDAHRCRRRWRCHFSRSMFVGTWFERSHMSVSEVCQMNCLWLNLLYPRMSRIHSEIGISLTSVQKWSWFCREVCIFWLSRQSEILGGPGVVVEIDEAKFRTRTYNRDRWTGEQWFFVGFECGSKKCFLVSVPSRESDMLLEVVREWIHPGTTVVSDCWKAYDCLSSEGFVHESVNHLKNFVDPSTRAHAQNIGKTWREVRGRSPRFGRKNKHTVGHLAEFTFKRKYSDYLERVHAFFTAVGQLYSPAPQHSG